MGPAAELAGRAAVASGDVELSGAGGYDPLTMGQPITVIEKPSSVPGTVRYEINRNLTGMGHERYVAGTTIDGERPPDRLARDLFARGGIDVVHVYNNVITIDLDEHRDAEGLTEIIEGLYIYYRPGVEVVIPEGAEA